jgi:purine catabolism regulator
MQLTLREALTLAEPLRKARVVAGERGLDNVVGSVNVMEVPDIIDWVHPGELLVSTFYPLRDDKAAVESLIPQLAEKGLAGLAVTPESYIDELPKSMVSDANRLHRRSWISKRMSCSSRTPSCAGSWILFWWAEITRTSPR